VTGDDDGGREGRSTKYPAQELDGGGFAKLQLTELTE
jgi:hypothetical protein